MSSCSGPTRRCARARAPHSRSSGSRCSRRSRRTTATAAPGDDPLVLVPAPRGHGRSARAAHERRRRLGRVRARARRVRGRARRAGARAQVPHLVLGAAHARAERGVARNRACARSSPRGTARTWSSWAIRAARISRRSSVNRWPEELRARVRKIVLIGLERARELRVPPRGPRARRCAADGLADASRDREAHGIPLVYLRARRNRNDVFDQSHRKAQISHIRYWQAYQFLARS